MKKFLIQIVLFLILAAVCGEIIVRAFKLVSDVPQRQIDQETGLQMYKSGQTGYSRLSGENWLVNDYGWLGVTNTDKTVQFSVIGDSYIENFMNPITCNQGYLLQELCQDMEYCFFEAGRSGVSFIEALEISNKLNKDINPSYHLIYLNNNDFIESVANKGRLSDIVQIDLEKNEVLRAKLKAPFAKKILYSSKLLYYFYNRFPVFVAEQNKGETKEKKVKAKTEFDLKTYNKLFEYSAKNYSRDKIILVFHPGINEELLTLAQNHDFKYIALESQGDKTWAINEHDPHWSCYGHKRVASQVKQYLDDL